MILRTSIKQLKSARVLLRPVIIGALCLFAGAMLGCGKPFNVKARTDLPPANYAATSATANVSVQAQAIRDEDFLYETFDANLISAGVLPVRVMLKNSSDRTVDLQKARFEIRQQAGRSFKAVTTREAFKRLISYYEIKAFNKAGYKESLGTFSEYGVDLKNPLEPGQSRQGLMFFLIPDEAARGAALTLVVSRLGGENTSLVELKLN
jgi:hypothetical protein